MRLSIVILVVEDLERVRSFYRDMLGGRGLVDTTTYVEVGFGEMRLGLYERHGFGQNIETLPVPRPARELSSTELYFHVDDLDGACDLLASAGVTQLSSASARDWGEVVAYFADPEGNVIALARGGSLSPT